MPQVGAGRGPDHEDDVQSAWGLKAGRTGPNSTNIGATLALWVRFSSSIGDTDEQVKAYLVERYGSFVLLEPPVKETTWILWFGPFAVVLVGESNTIKEVKDTEGARVRVGG